MPPIVKKAFRASVAALALVALAAIIYFGWHQIGDAATLHRTWNLGWLCAALMCQLLVYLCIAGMFKLSLRSADTPPAFGFLLYCAFAFLFANRSLPGPAVIGVATLVYLMRGKRIPSIDAQAVAGAFYFSDYAGFFTLIAAVSVPLFVGQPNHAVTIAYVVAIAIIGASAVFAVFVFVVPELPIRIVASVASFSAHLVGRPELVGTWNVFVRESITGLHSKIVAAASSPERLAGYFLLSLVMHLAEVSTVVFGARAAGISLAFDAAAASYVGGNLASIVSVLPGAVGFYEAGMIGTMHVLGHLSLGDCAVCTLTYRVLSFWAPLPVVGSLLLKVSREGLHGASKQDNVSRT